jgi:hypothetical protein
MSSTKKLIKYNYRSEFFNLSILMRWTPITGISITRTHILGRKINSNRGVRGEISRKISFLKCSQFTKGQERIGWDRKGLYRAGHDSIGQGRIE